jgi:hypothetical protein
MEYWVYSCSIWLKNNTVHGINKPWIEKTSTDSLVNPYPTGRCKKAGYRFVPGPLAMAKFTVWEYPEKPDPLWLP